LVINRVVGVSRGSLEVLVDGVVLDSGLNGGGSSDDLGLVDLDNFGEQSQLRSQSLDGVVVGDGSILEVSSGLGNRGDESSEDVLAVTEEVLGFFELDQEDSDFLGELDVDVSQLSGLSLDLALEVGGVRVALNLVLLLFFHGGLGLGADLLDDGEQLDLDNGELLNGVSVQSVDRDSTLLVIDVGISDLFFGSFVDTSDVVHDLGEDFLVLLGIQVDEVSESLHDIVDVRDLEELGVEVLDGLLDDIEDSEGLSVVLDVSDVNLGGLTSSVQEGDQIGSGGLHGLDVLGDGLPSLGDLIVVVADHLGDSVALDLLLVSEGDELVEGGGQSSLLLGPSGIFGGDIVLSVVDESLEQVKNFGNNSFSLLGKEIDEVSSHFFDGSVDLEGGDL